MSDAADAYDAWHDARESGNWDDPPMAPWHLLTIAHLPEVRGKRVLEIGCGRGVFARYLAERGAEVVAADFSPAAVEHARRRLEGLHATALVADIQDVPFPDGDFDVVVSQETLEHVPDPMLGLAELVRVTRPGGKLIVTTPNYLSLMGVWRLACKIVGKPYSEVGQPINQPLMLFHRVRALRRLGCRVDAVAGTHQLLVIPGFATVRLPDVFERPQSVMKWVCFHGVTAATRVGGSE
jgi:2-polyprenyl-3-methyl-5-hydroxy-6-metoxy-1,4-benzoquinol methylase